MTAARDGTPTGSPAEAAVHDAVTGALLRHRRGILAGVIASVAAATLFVAASLLVATDRPWTGLTLLRSGSDDAAVVIVQGIGRQSPAADAGLQVGDEVRRIGGLAPTATERLLALHDRLRPGDRLALDLTRDGRPVTTTLVVAPLLQGAMAWTMTGVRVAIVFALFYGLATLVYRWRPGDPRALLFALVSATVGTSMLMMAVPGGLSKPPETILPLPEAFARVNWAGVVIVAASGAATGPLLLHFVLLFPRPRLAPEILRPLLTWSYLLQPVCVALAVPSLAAALLAGRPPTVRGAVLAVIGLALAGGAWLVWRRVERAGPLASRLARAPVRTAMLATLVLLAAVHLAVASAYVAGPSVGRIVAPIPFFGAALALGICLAVAYPVGAVTGLWSAWTMADARERQQIKWPLIGIATTLTMAMALSIGAAAWSFRGDAVPGRIYTVLEVATWIAYSLIPLSFAMAILRYGLMDIRIIIRLTFLYAATSASLAVGAAASVLLVTAMVGRATESGRLQTILLTLLVVGMVEPVRRRIQRALDVRFYQEAPDPAGVLARHGEALRQVTRRDDLERRLVVALQEAVPHRATLLFRARDDRGQFEPGLKAGADADDLAAATQWLEERHATLHGPLRIGEDTREAHPRVWERLGVELLLPIRHADTVHLVVAIGRKRSDEGWSERDLELLSSIAAQTAMALGGMQARVRDASLREALDNQRALLPATMPQAAGYSLAGAWHPALAVGGDYYDAWWLSDDAMALCIADVSGKGLPASLVMANLQATVKALAAPDLTPAALCTRVNQTMAANLRRGRFVTFFFGILWPAQHRFTFANAGHNPPVLVAPSATRSLGLGDPALGLLRTHDYRDAEVHLEPGARLLLFTDGITEGRSPAGDEFGTERLTALVARPQASGAALRDDVLSAIAAWTQGRFDDDVTMIAIVRQS